MTDNARMLIKTLIDIYGRVGDFYISPCDGAILVSEADQLAEKAVEIYTDEAAQAERARIVAWLRSDPESDWAKRDWHLAKQIEEGEHLT